MVRITTDKGRRQEVALLVQSSRVAFVPTVVLEQPLDITHDSPTVIHELSKIRTADDILNILPRSPAR